MEHLISLELGDTGGDGHDKSSSIYIKSNVERTELARMIRSKEVRSVFDTNEECSEYEESSLSYHCTKKLRELDLLNDDTECADEDRLPVWRDDYVNILLSVVQHFYPEFEYEEIRLREIDIGGYGLFN